VVQQHAESVGGAQIARRGALSSRL
jgi:hypothetical protein